MADKGPEKNLPAAATEVTPLLNSAQAGSVAENLHDDSAVEDDETQSVIESEEEDEGPSLPLGQILVLAYARVIEPIAFFSIFPFISKMIENTGDIEPTDIGFYSGLIESLFSLTQMMFMIPWGRASDRFGRKPILVISLAGVTVSTTIFGLSKNIWQMIAFRCLAGAFGGSVVTIRTMFAEISTKRTQARAFSYFALAGNLGIFLGPLFGGALATPAEQYPSLFGHVKLFKEYPYFLPGIGTGIFSASAAFISAVFVKETLKSKIDKNVQPGTQMSTWDIVKYPGVPIVLAVYGCTALLGLAFTAVYPVYSYTPIKYGGLELDPLKISLLIAGAGFAQAIWSILIFPPLHDRIGTDGVLYFSFIYWPFSFLQLILYNVFLKQGWTTAFWVAMGYQVFIASGVSMAFTTIQLAINDIAPSTTTLGTLNAVVLSMASGIRAVAPALFSSLYATGVRLQIFDGQLVWVVLTVMVIPMFVLLRWFPERAKGTPKKKIHSS